MSILRIGSLLATVFLLTVVLTPTPAQADSLGWQGWGVRAGMTDDQDQVVGGVHFNLGEVTRNVRFQPDVVLGGGDDQTTVFGTAPLYYRFARPGLVPYAGGGLAMGFIDRDLPPGATGDDSEFEVGARATGGLDWPRRSGNLLMELSLGFGGISDVQFVLAWSF